MEEISLFEHLISDNIYLIKTHSSHAKKIAGHQNVEWIVERKGDLKLSQELMEMAEISQVDLITSNQNSSHHVGASCRFKFCQGSLHPNNTHHVGDECKYKIGRASCRERV